MQANKIYLNALALLGYSDTEKIRKNAVAVINSVYLDVAIALGLASKITLVVTLNDEINLPKNICALVMPLGVAEKLSVLQGDTELEQYFAQSYANARARLSYTDNIIDALPGGRKNGT
ncbi:MAG: hypothetical protein IJP26_00715 [Clostridia bacterium]|nr:hypothetical protein [Clostridia bacterium]